MKKAHFGPNIFFVSDFTRVILHLTRSCQAGDEKLLCLSLKKIIYCGCNFKSLLIGAVMVSQVFVSFGPDKRNIFSSENYFFYVFHNKSIIPQKNGQFIADCSPGLECSTWINHDDNPIHDDFIARNFQQIFSARFHKQANLLHRIFIEALRLEQYTLSDCI